MPLSTRCFLEECGLWRASCLLPLSPSSFPQEVCSSANRKLNQGTESSTRASKNSTLWRKAQWDKGKQGGRDVLSLRPWARSINPIHAMRTQWRQEQGLAMGCPQPGFPQRPWDHLRPKQGPSVASPNYTELCRHAALWPRNERSPKNQVLKTFSFSGGYRWLGHRDTKLINGLLH